MALLSGKESLIVELRFNEWKEKAPPSPLISPYTPYTPATARTFATADWASTSAPVYTRSTCYLLPKPHLDAPRAMASVGA